MALVTGRPAGLRAVVLDIGATADLDVATTDMLAALFTELGKRGVELRLAQVRGSVRDRMRRTGLVDAHRRGALVPVRRGRRRGTGPGARGTGRRAAADRGVAADWIAADRRRAARRLASRAGPDRDPGHDDDRERSEREEEDVAGDLGDPRSRIPTLVAGPLPEATTSSGPRSVARARPATDRRPARRGARRCRSSRRRRTRTRC